MKNILKHKNKIIIGVLIIAVLAFTFWWGGDSPSLKGENPSGSVSEQVKKNKDANDVQSADEIKEELILENESDNAAKEDTINSSEERISENEPPSADSLPAENIKKPGEEATAENKPQRADNMPMSAEEKIALAEQMAGEAYTQEAENDEYFENNTNENTDKAEPPLQDKPAPVNPEDTKVTEKTLTCTLTVRCDTILQNIAWLEEEKVDIVPKDGVIFAEKEVTFYEGESVFNVLLREMKKNKIHLEFVNTPIYNSAYIEGIANLYEFDCGELSGWVYKVNDWFPNYGASRYMLHQGDKIEWLYTCDLGRDVGSYGGWQKDE